MVLSNKGNCLTSFNSDFSRVLHPEPLSTPPPQFLLISGSTSVLKHSRTYFRIHTCVEQKKSLGIRIIRYHLMELFLYYFLRILEIDGLSNNGILSTMNRNLQLFSYKSRCEARKPSLPEGPQTSHRQSFKDIWHWNESILFVLRERFVVFWGWPLVISLLLSCVLMWLSLSGKSLKQLLWTIWACQNL